VSRRLHAVGRRATAALASLALAIGSLVAVPAAASEPKAEEGLFPIALANDLLLQFAQPRAGQADAASKWSQQQLNQVLRIPGVRAGQFLVANVSSGAVSKPAFEHLLMYELGADAGPDLETELATRLQDGRLPKGDELFEPTAFNILFRPLWNEIKARDIPGTTPEPLGAGPLRVNYLFVLSDAASPEQEDAYNYWYDRQHVPDVLRVPGFVSAQRYVRIAGNPKAPRYMVIFKFKARDNDATNAEIRRRIQAGITKMSPAFGMSPEAMALGGSYAPTGPRVVAPRSR
jgi:hypothetical protein